MKEYIKVTRDIFIICGSIAMVGSFYELHKLVKIYGYTDVGTVHNIEGEVKISEPLKVILCNDKTDMQCTHVIGGSLPVYNSPPSYR